MSTSDTGELCSLTQVLTGLPDAARATAPASRTTRARAFASGNRFSVLRMLRQAAPMFFSLDERNTLSIMSPYPPQKPQHFRQSDAPVSKGRPQRRPLTLPAVGATLVVAPVCAVRAP